MAASIRDQAMVWDQRDLDRIRVWDWVRFILIPSYPPNPRFSAGAWRLAGFVRINALHS